MTQRKLFSKDQVIIEQSIAVQRPRGTTVKCRDLFYNQPVRQRDTERHVKTAMEVLQRIAIIHPKISFSFRSQYHEMQFKSVSSIKERMKELVFSSSGKHVTLEDIHEFEMRMPNFTINGVFSRIERILIATRVCYLCHMHRLTFAQMFQYFFVNRKPLINSEVHKEWLDKFPFTCCIVNIQCEAIGVRREINLI